MTVDVMRKRLGCFIMLPVDGSEKAFNCFRPNSDKCNNVWASVSFSLFLLVINQSIVLITDSEKTVSYF